MRAKFRNDWNFLVREIGRGRDEEERSLEMTEVPRTGAEQFTTAPWPNCLAENVSNDHLNYPNESTGCL